jgi:hypothetical protein
MVHPAKTMIKKAKFGFCSLTIKARNVAIKAIPIIWRISIAGPSLNLEIKRQI